MVPCAYVPLSEQSQTGRALGLTGLAPNMQDETLSQKRREYSASTAGPGI